MEQRFPTEVRRLEGKGISLTWSDGTRSELNSQVLRRECPCATCRERRGDTSHGAPLSPRPAASMLKVVDASSDEELKLVRIWSVGNYALGIEWGDGHTTGIYTFPYLYELSSK